MTLVILPKRNRTMICTYAEADQATDFYTKHIPEYMPKVVIPMQLY